MLILMHKMRLHIRSCSITDLTQMGMVQLPQIPATHITGSRCICSILPLVFRSPFSPLIPFTVIIAVCPCWASDKTR